MFCPIFGWGMDMAQAHWHQTSLVDLETKSVAHQQFVSTVSSGICLHWFFSAVSWIFKELTGCMGFSTWTLNGYCRFFGRISHAFGKPFPPPFFLTHIWFVWNLFVWHHRKSGRKGSLILTFFCWRFAKTQAMMQGAFQALEQLQNGMEPEVEKPWLI